VQEYFQVKCHQYWPLGSEPGVDDVMELTDVGLKVQFISEDDAPYYTTRILRSGSSTLPLHEPFYRKYQTNKQQCMPSPVGMRMRR
jgi:hypothetical protein